MYWICHIYYPVLQNFFCWNLYYLHAFFYQCLLTKCDFVVRIIKSGFHYCSKNNNSFQYSLFIQSRDVDLLQGLIGAYNMGLWLFNWFCMPLSNCKHLIGWLWAQTSARPMTKMYSVAILQFQFYCLRPMSVLFFILLVLWMWYFFQLSVKCCRIFLFPW